MAAFRKNWDLARLEALPSVRPAFERGRDTAEYERVPQLSARIELGAGERGRLEQLSREGAAHAPDDVIDVESESVETGIIDGLSNETTVSPDADDLEYATTLLELGALAAQKSTGQGAHELFARALDIARARRPKATAASLEAALAALRLVHGARDGRSPARDAETSARELVARFGLDPHERDTGLRMLRILQSLSALDAAERARATAAPQTTTPRPDPVSDAVLDGSRLELSSRQPSLAAAAYARHQNDSGAPDAAAHPTAPPDPNARRDDHR